MAEDRLQKIAKNIQAEQKTCLGLVRKTAEHARKIGGLLLRAKKMVQHGQWENWLKANFDGSQSSAIGYMKIAKQWPELESKSQSIVNFGIADAIRLLAAPRSKEPSSGPAEANQEPIGAEPETTTDVASTTSTETSGVVSTTSEKVVTCPRCGGHEVDDEGDCAACLEPNVVAQQNVVGEPDGAPAAPSDKATEKLDVGEVGAVMASGDDEAIAKLFGTTPEMMERASRVKEADPELAKRVSRGEIDLDQAEAIVEHKIDNAVMRTANRISVEIHHLLTKNVRKAERPEAARKLADTLEKMTRQLRTDYSEEPAA